MQWRHFFFQAALGRLVLALVATIFAIILWSQLRGNAPASAIAWQGVTFGLLFLFLASMHVRIRIADELHVRFWPLPGKRVQFFDIESVEVVQYRPIRDYGGWGIKWGKGGVAFTTGGKIGIKVQLASGRHLMLSAKKPAAVCAAIQEKIYG